MQFDQRAALRLNLVTESDPGALVRVLHLLQGRNIVPLQVLARRTADEALAIEIAVARSELGADALDLIVRKLAQMPFVQSALACSEPSPPGAGLPARA